MKSVKAVVEYLKSGDISYIFGIPAGSVNAFFDELYDSPEITPIVTKHEGAASYMAAAYAKYSKKLAVCIGSSGPGGTNLVTGAANAMREHLPVLFLTGAVPVNTMGHNASQELDAHPIFESVTKYSKRVDRAEDLLKEIHKAVETAISGVPGPVHIAMPIDVQLSEAEDQIIPPFPKRAPLLPEDGPLYEAVMKLTDSPKGFIFAGQGIRGCADQLIELAELLNWPIISSPQAKGLIPDNHPLYRGIFGFAGHESASSLINEGDFNTVLVAGSSLGETATNNYNQNITKNRTLIQIDFDQSVFNRRYETDVALSGDMDIILSSIIEGVKNLGYQRADLPEFERSLEEITEEYSTRNVLLKLQRLLPLKTRYTIDIGEFMAYVIHHMNVAAPDSFDINVHFGAMGSGIGSAIGSKLAHEDCPTVCITGDGCFFMHGMELLTAKEYDIPVLFVVMNNARLGMVHHGHALQYKRAHQRFSQEPVAISSLAETMGIPSFRVKSMEDLNESAVYKLLNQAGPAILEIALVDDRVPPMGDRVKFLSSFGK
ncbi:thiamine pyrophosphate-binding protein [Halobacillus sp. Marseille-Q1614]|uniref:thiamine pyrophosphate-binding protein n=1 Tax=Halobacillus sp. Marseille-Q1614 TaxID=2709134 RepID=UPI00156E1868|nr:thiamine pyrophosphate-binding protein [Halobacillus sp. Marseille-Q1614]